MIPIDTNTPDFFFALHLRQDPWLKEFEVGAETQSTLSFLLFSATGKK